MRRGAIVGLFVIVAFALVSLTFSQPTTHTTRYVNNTDPTCLGHSPCFSTIQAAIDAAQPGDIVLVQAGQYDEALVIKGKNNTAKATEADRIIIEADPAAPPGSVMLGSASQKCAKGDAIAIESSKFITIRGLTITDAGGQSIVLAEGAKKNEAIHIERNRIFGNGTNKCLGGILVGKDNIDTLILNNLIYGNGQHGLNFKVGKGGPHYVINNTIHGNGHDGISIGNGRLVRKPLSHSKQKGYLQRHVELEEAIYNFVRPHGALRVRLRKPLAHGRRWKQRTPLGLRD